MNKTLFSRIIKESIPALVVAAILGLIAGAAMQFNFEIWTALPIFLMLVPPLNDLGNDLSCIVSSRISTLLALGIIEPSLKMNEALKENIISISIVGFVASIYLGIINHTIAESAGVKTISIWSFMAICVIAIVLLTLMVTFISIGVAFVSWRRGLDPDNITIPICTSISDVLGIFCLLIAINVMSIIT